MTNITETQDWFLLIPISVTGLCGMIPFALVTWRVGIFIMDDGP